MSSRSALRRADHLSGWVLAESRFPPDKRFRSSRLLIHRSSKPGQKEEIPVPVFFSGRIQQLIELPDDVTGVELQRPEAVNETSPLRVRRVGWIERNIRMAVRVWRTLRLIPEHQRAESGLTLWGALKDLPGAYRAATAFRVRYPILDYKEWIARFDTLRQEDVVRIRSHIALFKSRPRFHLLLVADAQDRQAIETTLASLRAQLYADFSCTILDSAGALGPDMAAELSPATAELHLDVVTQHGMSRWLADFNSRLAAMRTDEWIMLLRAGDTLPAYAFYWLACEIQANPDAAVLYSDDDEIGAEGERFSPRFKPDWSPEHLHSTHYVGSAALFRSSAIFAAGGISRDCCHYGNYELLLRVTSAAKSEKIIHVPAVLLHRSASIRPSHKWEDSQWCTAAAQMHLARKGVKAEVVQTSAHSRRVRYLLPQTPPLVSIIVPTRDAMGLLRECIESLRERTLYPRYEILVFDNDTVEHDALDYLKKISEYPGLRVIRFNQPFNYSTINNLAAAEAQGEILCLLNNDTWVISSDWLNEMVGHLIQEGVGAVGAKLYYPDTRVQHAGVTVGPGGCADHLHIGVNHSDPGYCHRAMVAHELSAVTGACLATWKHLYTELGGMNEEQLTVAFNDVDYCLRLQDAGYRVIFTPHAELFHHESATRGRDERLRERIRANHEVKYMRLRWGERMQNDPYYNPNLSYQRPDFSLSEHPRVKKPWLSQSSDF